jgi:hypothetical protein
MSGSVHPAGQGRAGGSQRLPKVLRGIERRRSGRTNLGVQFTDLVALIGAAADLGNSHFFAGTKFKCPMRGHIAINGDLTPLTFNNLLIAFGLAPGSSPSLTAIINELRRPVFGNGFFMPIFVRGFSHGLLAAAHWISKHQCSSPSDLSADCTAGLAATRS